MNTSNFKYPFLPRWIVQGTDAGTWLDSIWHSENFKEAQAIADEKQRAQGGQWRVVLNKYFARGEPR